MGGGANGPVREGGGNTTGVVLGELRVGVPGGDDMKLLIEAVGDNGVLPVGELALPGTTSG